MFSKEWKIAAVALMSLVLVTGCQKSKKKNRPGTQYAGIWVLEENLSVHARYKANYCGHVKQHPYRYGDPNNEYRPRAIMIAGNGEVYHYEVGTTAYVGDLRTQNFIGIVNPAGAFTAGSIGYNGQFQPAPTWNANAYNPYDIPLQTTFVMRGVNLVIVSRNDTYIYRRALPGEVDAYMMDTIGCLKVCRTSRCVRFEEREPMPEGPISQGPPPRRREKDMPPRRAPNPRLVDKRPQLAPAPQVAPPQELGPGLDPEAAEDAEGEPERFEGR